MDQPDLSEYEALRAEQHEELCRLAATLALITHRVCRLRACRRRRVCSGPMMASPHQAGKVRAQREIGLSGHACANLPICIAHREPEYYEIFRQTTESVRDMRADEPDIGLLLGTFIQAAAMRRPKRKVS
ncbi:hypothetical protein [Neorhizobium sp. LjRoot104]|uniref:hypothetical protein n=1 Tax=Neorhizobium sp. LjRoot104 TaxID=3342254 RepID=UPI003ECCBD06